MKKTSSNRRNNSLESRMEQVIVGLNRYGFGSQLAFSIYQTYQEETPFCDSRKSLSVS